MHDYNVASMTQSMGLALSTEAGLYLQTAKYPNEAEMPIFRRAFRALDESEINERRNYEFPLSDTIHLCRKSNAGGCLQDAITHRLACRLFSEVALEVQLISTSEVCLDSIERIVSTWVLELKTAVKNATTRPYEELDKSSRNLLLPLKRVSRPTQSQVRAHIAKHKTNDLCDDVIGWLREDIDDDAYSTEVDIPGGVIDFRIKVGQAANPDRRIQVARGVFAQIQSLDQTAREYAAAELLDSCRDWQQRTVTRDEFIVALEPTELTLEEDDTMEIWYKDGNMFLGHGIRVQITSSAKFTLASIEG